MGNWNFADMWEVVADDLPDAPCLIHGDDRRTWSEVDRRADGVAQHLLDAGLARQQAVAQYLYNCPEYLESMFAAFKAAFVPVNTNYRYTADELLYLWDNADAGAVVFHGTFAVDHRADQGPVAEGADVAVGRRRHGRLPRLGRLVRVGRDERRRSGRAGVGTQRRRPQLPLHRRHDRDAEGRDVAPGRPGRDAQRLTRQPARRGRHGRRPARHVTRRPGSRFLPACPQMHGTGNFPCLSTLSGGGSIVTLDNRTFDPAVLLDTIEREGVNTMAMVGDAFGKPILRTLDENPGRWDLSSLVAIVSSGVMWSKETKEGLLRHHPGMLLMDAFSSSEALGMGSSIERGRCCRRHRQVPAQPEHDRDRRRQPSGRAGVR